MKCSMAKSLGGRGDNNKQRNWLTVLNHQPEKTFSVSPPGQLDLVVHIS